VRRWVGAGLFVALGIASVAIDGPDGATATPERPNVLVVVTDDQELGALQHALPYLDSEPGGHWVRFENAVVNTALCCPSRATLFTGQYSHHHGVINNSLGERLDDTSTVATWLDDAGYRTGLVGKYLNLYPFPQRGPVVPPGWDSWVAFNRKLAYKDFDTINGAGIVVRHQTGYSTDVMTKFARRFVKEPSPDPFFLYLAYYAPHEPGTPAKRHKGALKGLRFDRPPNFNEADVDDKPAWVHDLPLLSPEEARELNKDRRRGYESLLSVDEGIAQLFELLDDAGTLDDTVVIFMSDNGFVWGEHRYTGKNCAYEECHRVPLLVRYPDGPAGTRTIDDLISNVDIAPTLADLAGTAPATPVDGSSLVPVLEGASPVSRDGVLIERRGFTPAGKPPSYWGVRTSTHKWVEYDNGERELYDLVADPYELDNLAGTDPDLEAELHDLLVDLRGS
jgi:N-acetylglucosamine-6-sulfatase